jgi:hypothetical protein
MNVLQMDFDLMITRMLGEDFSNGKLIKQDVDAE